MGLILQVASLVCFLWAAFGTNRWNIDMVALGLAFYVAAGLVGSTRR